MTRMSSSSLVLYSPAYLVLCIERELLEEGYDEDEQLLVSSVQELHQDGRDASSLHLLLHLQEI